MDSTKYIRLTALRGMLSTRILLLGAARQEPLTRLFGGGLVYGRTSAGEQQLRSRLLGHAARLRESSQNDAFDEAWPGEHMEVRTARPIGQQFQSLLAGVFKQ
jgi:hypothetical protein